MSVTESVIEKLKSLPPDKQQELLDFAEFLEQKAKSRQPRQSLEGIWEDLNVKIAAEDIAEARREMWGNFPRERFRREGEE